MSPKFQRKINKKSSSFYYYPYYYLLVKFSSSSKIRKVRWRTGLEIKGFHLSLRKHTMELRVCMRQVHTSNRVYPGSWGICARRGRPGFIGIGAAISLAKLRKFSPADIIYFRLAAARLNLSSRAELRAYFRQRSKITCSKFSKNDASFEIISRYVYNDLDLYYSFVSWLQFLFFSFEELEINW